MDLFKKIEGQITSFYKKHIICEQYPMLTSTNRKEWLNKGALGVVYMLHHITKKNSSNIPNNEDLKVSPSFLEKIIREYKRQDFDFISLDSLHRILTSGAIIKRPFIVFTIDDGYLDNYTNALPVFEKYDVPFAIFVATDFIDKKAILWWDVIEKMILQGGNIQTRDGHVYCCNTFQQKWDTFRLLRERILLLDQTRLEEELNNMFCYNTIDWYEPIRNQGMSWEQISILSHHPLCTIGGHTVSHPALNKLDEATYRWEIEEGVKRIEKVTGTPIEHFAYPYGLTYEKGTLSDSLFHKFNFKTAFAATGGCITKDNQHRIALLPRVFLKQ